MAIRLFTFQRGGVHPPENKTISEHKSITEIPLPDTVFINLNQHLGKPAKCLVKAKQDVSVGERIGEADGFISAHVHSSVSGQVKKIQQMMTAVGTMAETIVIDVDKEKTEQDSLKFREPADIDINRISQKDLLDKIKEHGIVGEGGATFSTHVKLSPPPDKKVDSILINGAECEPFLTADHQLMLEQTEQILKGIQIIQKILNVQTVYIGIENNKPDAMDRFQQCLNSNSFPGITVAGLKTKYPQGGEKQLIQAVLGRQVPSGKLPFDVGCLVQNIGTVYAIYEAIYRNKSLWERVTTITGFVQNPGNFRIRIGTTFEHAVNAGAGGFKDNDRVNKVINGGPMMGKTVRQLDVSLTKGTSGILVLADEDIHYEPEGPCIRCGRCVSHCPMGLMPTALAMAAQFNNPDGLKNIMDCIECGTCSYICPTHRQLVHWLRIGKTIFRNASRSGK